MTEAGVDGDLKIFTGNAHPALAREICDQLGVSLGMAEVRRFADGEAYCHIQENIRGTDVFVILPTCPPVDSNLLELLVMLDAFKRSSTARVTAVIPYYGYARQDRKDKPRVPITAKLVADLLTAAGASRILAMDLHAPAIQGFFDIPVDHLFAAPVMIEHVARMQLKDLVVVAPDAGGVASTRCIGPDGVTVRSGWLRFIADPLPGFSPPRRSGRRPPRPPAAGWRRRPGRAVPAPRPTVGRRRSVRPRAAGRAVRAPAGRPDPGGAASR